MAKKGNEDKDKLTPFVNPFVKGVSYADFLAAKGEKTTREYCEGQLTNEQIVWLEQELEHLKNK